MYRKLMMLLVPVAVTTAVACGGGATPEPTTPAAEPKPPHEASPMDDGEAQAARGAQLYAKNCASCHGDTGGGPCMPG